MLDLNAQFLFIFHEASEVILPIRSSHWLLNYLNVFIREEVLLWSNEYIVVGIDTIYQLRIFMLQYHSIDLYTRIRIYTCKFIPTSYSIFFLHYILFLQFVLVNDQPKSLVHNTIIKIIGYVFLFRLEIVLPLSYTLEALPVEFWITSHN